jgi:glucose/arabinose dehydrogenase
MVLLFSIMVSSLAWGQVQDGYSVHVAFSQLTFSQPVGIVSAGDGSNRLFVVEQAAIIRVFQNSANTAASTVFLDISDRVLFGGEQGLLGLAFHPNFAQNGYFYVDYVAANPTRTVISRFTVPVGSPNQADKTTEFVLLEIPQPFANHKGGQIAFGLDGYLYIGMGDGGSQGDPLGNGQSLYSHLGKILRIDVNLPSIGLNYGIPADNPFVGNTLGYRQEIFAYGFRNPWRFSFDFVTGKLWAGDVGQSRLEEIDVVEKGKNYGWNLMEGSLPYAGGALTGLELPIYEYDHTLGNAIVGGYVYHGSSLAGLGGFYVYGDYGSGRIWALSVNSGAVSSSLLVASGLTISSFGVDQAGELYICAFDGKIYQLTSTAIPEFSGIIPIVAVAAVPLMLAVAFKKRFSGSRFPGQRSL